MTTLWRELRYASRLLSRNPGFSATVVIVLALGIGTNIAIYNVIDLIMMKKLTVKDPQQLVLLRWRSQQTIPKEVMKQAFGNDTTLLFSMSTYQYIASRQRGLAGLFAFANAAGGPARIFLKVKGHGVLADGDVVTGTYFPTLEVKPSLGRLLSPEDDHPGSPPVVVISYSFWLSQFPKDSEALGDTILIGGSPFTIVGVTPPEFTGVEPGKSPDFWEPVSQWDGMKATMQNMGSDRDSPTTWWLTVMGRLKPGTSKQQILPEMNGLYRQSLEANVNSNITAEALPSLDIVTADRGTSDMRQRFSHPLLSLMSIVALGLLIACGSVGVMMMARARSRSSEAAIRLALGASRTRLITQFLIESILLVGISTILGGILAYWASFAVMRLIFGYVQTLGFVAPARGLDLSVFAFSAGVAVLTGVMCGLLPSRLAMRADVASTLKEGRESSNVARRARWVSGGRVLIVLQVAISLLVLVGAGLFIRTIRNLEDQDLGFNGNNLLVFDVNATVGGYHNSALAALYERITERIQGLPGVISASSSTASLISPWSISVPLTLHADGEHPDRTTVVPINMVGPSFFETMEIPVVRGRPLILADQTSTKRVAIANQAFVRHFLADGDPIGKAFTFGQVAVPSSAYELVGVSGDAKYMSVSESPSPMVYIPYSQFSGLLNNLPVGMHFEVRTRQNPGALVSSIRAAISDIDPAIPIDGIKTQIEQIDSSLAQERLLALFSGILGLFVLLLAATSVYGIQSHVVTKRKHEIAIRMALGATRFRVLRMIWWQSLGTALAGVTIGLIGALFTTRLIASQLYGVKSTDVGTIAGAAGVLIITALVGGYLPASKATSCDPSGTLRQI